jgi:hypothetical protein
MEKFFNNISIYLMFLAQIQIILTKDDSDFEMGFVCGKLGNFFDLLEKISIL